MKFPRKLLWTVVWILAATLPAPAQLDRVVAEAEGIDCLPCAATIEIAMKQIPGVNKVSVSMSKQMVAITFTEQGSFLPQEFRDAIAKAEVRVLAWHVAMRGKVEQEEGKQYFVSGKDRFLIAKAPKDLPVGTLIGIMAEIDDSSKPYKAMIDDFKLQ